MNASRHGAKPHPALTTRVLDDGAEWVPLAEARRLYDQGMEEGLALALEEEVEAVQFLEVI